MPDPVLVHPDEDLTFSHDWSSDWLASGEAISSRQWSITPQSGSPAQPSLTNATSATVRVSGFTHGQVYRLTEQVTTDQNQVGVRSVVLRCQKR